MTSVLFADRRLKARRLCVRVAVYSESHGIRHTAYGRRFSSQSVESPILNGGLQSLQHADLTMPIYTVHENDASSTRMVKSAC
ncbi:hypothetical protein ACLOJK_006114 [Asimina triloba]